MGSERVAGPIEIRVLDGPNLYFTRPAIKVTVSAKDWLTADDEAVLGAAVRLKLRGAARAASRSSGAPAAASARPGPPNTERRLRFVVRVAAHLTRELARAAGTHVAVRARPGTDPEQVIVAYPWRRRAAAEAFGREVAALFGASLRSETTEDLVADAVARLAETEPGAAPAVPEPQVPVVAVTGTNGKTTTVRLLAHLI